VTTAEVADADWTGSKRVLNPKAARELIARQQRLFYRRAVLFFTVGGTNAKSPAIANGVEAKLQKVCAQVL
jgi:hypothetical protein